MGLFNKFKIEKYHDEVLLVRYKGKEKTVVIPDGVTVISGNVFEDNTYIETVVMPDSLKTIGNNAFKNCVNLRTIKNLENVEHFYDGAFIGCENLEPVTLYTKHGYFFRAFDWPYKLERVDKKTYRVSRYTTEELEQLHNESTTNYSLSDDEIETSDVTDVQIVSDIEAACEEIKKSKVKQPKRLK